MYRYHITLYLLAWVTCSLAAIPALLGQSAPPPAPEVAWSFDTGGPIWASSASHHGIVYFGSTDGNVYALDAASGRPEWSFETRGPLYGGVSIYGDYLYVLSDDGHLYKLHTDDGREMWRFDTHQSSVTERHAPAATAEGGSRWDFRSSAPVEDGSLVYVGSSDGRLYAVDAATGEKRWHFQTDDVVRSSPVVAGDLVLFGSFDGSIVALEKVTGAPRWTHETEKPINSTPAVHDGIAFIGSRDMHLYALRVADGTIVWKKTYDDGSWVESSGTVYDDILYIGSSDWDSALAIDLEDGSSKWQTRIMNGGVFSTPVITETAYYTGVYGFSPEYQPEGALVRLDRATGEIVWIHAFEDTPDQDSHGVTASPQIVDGLVLFGALDGTFYACREVANSTE